MKETYPLRNSYIQVGMASFLKKIQNVETFIVIVETSKSLGTYINKTTAALVLRQILKHLTWTELVRCS